MNAPNYDTHFGLYMTDPKTDIYVWDPGDGMTDAKVRKDRTLKENIVTILRPGITN